MHDTGSRPRLLPPPSGAGATAPAFRKIAAVNSFRRRATVGAGVHVGDAVSAAEGRLNDMRGRVTVEVDRLLEVLSRWSPGPEPHAQAPDEVRQAAEALVGLCAFVDLPELGRVAGSCCRLLGKEDDGRFAEGWRVHLDALKLFRTSPDAARRATIEPVLGGLHMISSPISRPATVDA